MAVWVDGGTCISTRWAMFLDLDMCLGLQNSDPVIL
jgi:hypothetical protein